jgi:superoxide dismutase, Fe-Mn family
MKEFVLPKLPYAYEALEPVIDAATVNLHHDKHHNGYVVGFNGTLKKIVEAREKSDYAAIKALDKDLAFHGSGVILHNMYWENLCPKADCKEPASGAFIDQVKADFGDLAKLKAEIGASAKAVEGSGWAVLVWEPTSKQMMVLQAENHQKLTIWGVVPLLVIDVWEHAYYLKYQNNRAAYVDALWGIVNWAAVEKRFKAVK